jgi:hypothetical protein
MTSVRKAREPFRPAHNRLEEAAATRPKPVTKPKPTKGKK